MTVAVGLADGCRVDDSDQGRDGGCTLGFVLGSAEGSVVGMTAEMLG